MHEMIGLQPYDEGLSEDEIPLMELRDVTVTKKDGTTGRYEQVDILTVFENGPFRMTGRLLPKCISKESNIIRVKSVFEHELLVSDIKKYAVEVTESEELKIWVLGKAGWYAIKPSAEYAAIFATVEEKARLWMFIQAFAAAEAEKKIKNPTFKKFLKEYHDEVPSAQETHITKHMGFVLINMINRRDEVEQKRWRTTLLYKWYTMRYSKEVATIESQVKKIWDKMDKIQLQIQQEEEEEEEEASTPKAKRRKTKATPRVARTPATPDTRAPASVARTRGAGREAGRGVKARKTGGRVGNHESGGGIVEEVEQGYQYRDEPEEKEHGYHCQYWDEPEEKEPASPPKARSPSPEAGPLNPDGPEGYESDSYPFYDRHSSARRLMGLPPRHLKPWPLHPWDQRPATSPHSPPPTNMWDSPKFCPDDPITMVKVPMKDTKTVRNGIWECTYKECKHCILDADTPEGIADIENHYIWHQRKAWKIMEAAGVEPMPRKWKTDAALNSRIEAMDKQFVEAQQTEPTRDKSSGLHKRMWAFLPEDED